MVSWAALSLSSPFNILVPLWPKGCNELAVVNSGADSPTVPDALCLGAVLVPLPGRCPSPVSSHHPQAQPGVTAIPFWQQTVFANRKGWEKKKNSEG